MTLPRNVLYRAQQNHDNSLHRCTADSGRRSQESHAAEVQISHHRNDLRSCAHGTPPPPLRPPRPSPGQSRTHRAALFPRHGHPESAKREARRSRRFAGNTGDFVISNVPRTHTRQVRWMVFKTTERKGIAVSLVNEWRSAPRHRSRHAGRDGLVTGEAPIIQAQTWRAVVHRFRRSPSRTFRLTTRYFGQFAAWRPAWW